MATRVAVISGTSGPMVGYSGGPYHAWVLAYALQEGGFETTLMTNIPHPAFEPDFSLYKPIQVVDIPLPHINAEHVHGYDAVFGVGVLGIVAAQTSTWVSDVPVFNVLIDFKTYLKNFDGVLGAGGSKNKVWELLEDYIIKGHVIVSGECLVPYAKDWVGHKIGGGVFAVSPAVNSRVFDKVMLEHTPESDGVVLIGRNVPLKNFRTAFKAMEYIGKCGLNPTLHVITNGGAKELEEEARNLNIRIRVHIGVSDMEKFRIIRGCRVMINPSLFEGWGLWMQEGLYGGKPVICYDMETLREISDGGKGVHLVQYGNEHRLYDTLHYAHIKSCKESSKIKEALGIRQKFTMESMTATLRSVVEQCIQS